MLSDGIFPFSYAFKQIKMHSLLSSEKAQDTRSSEQEEREGVGDDQGELVTKFMQNGLSDSLV